jgi:Cd2+/Zn2+-exporting ATPase
MQAGPGQEKKEAAPPGSRWIPSLSRFLQSRQEAQAVLWDDEETEVSIGVLGEVDIRELSTCLQETLSKATSGDTTVGQKSGLHVRRLDDRTLLEKPHGCDEVANLWTWRKVPWPSAAEAAGVEEEEDWRVLAALAGLCGVFGLAGWLVEMNHWGPAWLAPVLFIAGMIAGGWDAAKDAAPAVLRGRLDVHFLMLAVAVGASLIGAFAEGTLLLFLFSTAGALENFALYRTRREINALFRLAPKTACVLVPNTGEEKLVPIEEVRAGDRLLVRPGETFPVDGLVSNGETAADESALTGEAHPVEKQAGDLVSSGTLNLWGAVTVTCARPAQQSALQKVIDLIQSAKNQRAPSQRLTDRFGPSYTWGVLGVTCIMFFVWWLGFGVSPFLNVTTGETTEFSSFYRAMTLLVVASPCALVLSIPSAILAAIAWGARHGILFRGGAAIEQMADLNVVALDKTGTLTTGDLRVVSVESFPPGEERAVAEAAFAMEQKATHPIARAIVKYGQEQGLTLRELDNFRAITGQGVQAQIGEEACLLGRRDLLADGPLGPWLQKLPGPPPGLSEVWFVRGNLMGRILLEDRIREESAAVLQRLEKIGLRTVMLTGDRAEAANVVGQKLGLSEVLAGLTPEGKLEQLQRLKKEGGKVAMVGDGINDAPCLAAADIAVAMGARGSDAALEQSDVVLMNDKIENFYEAFELSRRARSVIRQNITISLGTIVVMVGAAVFGIVPITLGVLAHEGSTVLVCLNSMRLLGGQPKAPTSKTAK